MTVDHSAVGVPLMTQEVDPHNPPQSAVASLVSPDHPHQDEIVKPKSQGSSRRGKQYKCGHCHELGHNQKTCPRRASAGSEAASIQPALGVDTSDLFGGVASNVAPSLSVTGNGHAGPLALARLQPPKLEHALEAANKRVLAADKQVANASTDAEFEEATVVLDNAVRNFEKVASCAQRCAALAQTLGGGWESTSPVEREAKRMRLDPTSCALTPTTLTLNEATSGGAADAVDGPDDVSHDPKDEPLEA